MHEEKVKEKSQVEKAYSDRCLHCRSWSLRQSKETIRKTHLITNFEKAFCKTSSKP
jgi:hypothetical protein